MTERINIRRLQIPEEETATMRFDPARDIPDDFMRYSKRVFENRVNNSATVDIQTFAKFASRFHILDAHKGFVPDERGRGQIQAFYREAAREKRWKDYLEFAAISRLLWPDDDLGLEGRGNAEEKLKVRSAIVTTLHDYANRGDRDYCLLYSLYAHIVDPEFNWHLPQEKVASNPFKVPISSYDPSIVFIPALAAAGAHILYPGMWQLSEEDWAALKKGLDHGRSHPNLIDMMKYAGVALAMTILSSQKTEFVKGRGLVITAKKSADGYNQPAPAMLDI